MNEDSPWYGIIEYSEDMTDSERLYIFEHAFNNLTIIMSELLTHMYQNCLISEDFIVDLADKVNVADDDFSDEFDDLDDEDVIEN